MLHCYSAHLNIIVQNISDTKREELKNQKKDGKKLKRVKSARSLKKKRYTSFYTLPN